VLLSEKDPTPEISSRRQVYEVSKTPHSYICIIVANIEALRIKPNSSSKGFFPASIKKRKFW